MIDKLFAAAAAVFFTFLMGIPVLIKFVTVGPSKMLAKKKNGPQPPQLNDPRYGEHNYIKLKTVKLHYVISGPEDAPLMLMLHGFPEIWYSWRHQITAFQDKYRVTAIDMRGYGESDRPDRTEDYKMDLLVEDIKLFLDALNYKSCILVAHDWGGTVACAFANQHPEMVDKLIVMNMCPLPVWRKGFMSSIKQFFCSGYIFVFFMPYLPEFVTGLGDCGSLDKAFSDIKAGKKSGSITDDDVECYKYYFRQDGAYRAGINYYRANLWPPAYHQTLIYPMPIKVIWGCQDKYLTLGTLKSFTQAVPHVDVTRITDSSHWVQVDQPEKVNEAIRAFLQ